MDVVKERSADATALAALRPMSTASPYLAGYCVECALKAYLNRRGIRFPEHGKEGHNLRRFWHRAGFRKSDLKNPTGAKSYFIESWDTSLRYETAINSDLDAGELVKGAKQLTRWLSTQIRRHRRYGR